MRFLSKGCVQMFANGFVYGLLRDSGLNLVKKIGIENPPRDFRM